MIFRRAYLDTCWEAGGVVVVIDVLRAFSTSAYAFAAGAQKITLVDNVEEAFLMKRQFPSALLMGETADYSVKGFDYSNSPTEVSGENLAGCHLIQCTSVGTRGAVRCVNAEVLLASSLCCAKATAALLSQLREGTVTFVITGRHSDGSGDEDEACADYIQSLVSGECPDAQTYTQRVRDSKAGRKLMNAHQPGFVASDLEYCLAMDRFNFAMQVERRDGIFTMRAVAP